MSEKEPQPDMYGVFCGPITQDTAKSVTSMLAAFTIDRAERAHILFQSTGGLMADGIFLYEYFRSLPIDLYLYNAGAVQSVAAIAFLGATKRFITNTATFTVHYLRTVREFRFLFEFTHSMQISGHNKAPDWVKIGPSLLIASCLILATRTAKWAARSAGTNADRDLDVEIDHSIHLANRVLSPLITRKENLFPSKDVPWYMPSDEDVPK